VTPNAVKVNIRETNMMFKIYISEELDVRRRITKEEESVNK